MKLTTLLCSAATVSALWLASPVSAQVTGKVMLEGQAPDPAQLNMAADPKCQAAHPNPVLDDAIMVGPGNELANVVVNIKAPEGKKLEGAAPKDAITIDQKGCQYSPHVVGMMVGQQLVMKNSDPIPHNVHSVALDNDQFNIGQTQQGQENKVGDKIKVAERFMIKCDIHPWMTVQVNAFDHPFFAVSNDKGEFSIPTKGLADGKYEIEIWHEKCAAEPIVHEIEVKDGKAKVEDIKLPVPAANASAEGPGNEKLASATEKVCKNGGACCAAKSKAQAIADASAARK